MTLQPLPDLKSILTEELIRLHAAVHKELDTEKAKNVKLEAEVKRLSKLAQDYRDDLERISAAYKLEYDAHDETKAKLGPQRMEDDKTFSPLLRWDLMSMDTLRNVWEDRFFERRHQETRQRSGS